MKLRLSHPVVFLFGAGATRDAFDDRPIPPPLDADFFELAGHITGHGTEKLAKKVLKDVWSLYGTTSGIGLEYYYRDVETREKIGRFAKAANKPKDWQRRKDDLDELIRRVIIHTTCEEIDGHYKPIESIVHRRILSSLEDTDTLVTFNYDLLIEESFSKNSIWSPRDGYETTVHGITAEWCRHWYEKRELNPEKKGQIPLLKLHGSINWDQYSNGDLKLKNRPFSLRTKKKRVIPESISILPPGWNKKIEIYPYNDFWRAARLELENCSSIAILGYSLPETDLLARALFAEVVRHRARRKKNKFLDQLYIADPNSRIRERFLELFRPILGPKSKVFRFDYVREFSKNIF